MKEVIATTTYIAGQEYFVLPAAAEPKIRLEIFNKKRKAWRTNGYEIFIRPIGKKKKTDETIKIYFKPVKK